MRVALHEIGNRDDVPTEVAIDEAIELAKQLLRRRRPGLRQRHPRSGGESKRGRGGAPLG